MTGFETNEHIKTVQDLANIIKQYPDDDLDFTYSYGHQLSRIVVIITNEKKPEYKHKETFTVTRSYSPIITKDTPKINPRHIINDALILSGRPKYYSLRNDIAKILLASGGIIFFLSIIENKTFYELLFSLDRVLMSTIVVAPITAASLLYATIVHSESIL